MDWLDLFRFPSTHFGFAARGRTRVEGDQEGTWSSDFRGEELSTETKRRQASLAIAYSLSQREVSFPKTNFSDSAGRQLDSHISS